MNVIDLLSQWVSDPSNSTLENRASDIKKSDYHYYKEIIRYFNHLHFIVNKTRRSLSEETNLGLAYYLFITYHYFWEKSDFNSIFRDSEYNISLSDRKTLLKYYKRLSTWNWDISLKNKKKKEVVSIKYAVPSFFIQKLLPVLDYNQIQRNIVVMDQRSRKGITYLRINQNKLLNDDPQEELRFYIDHFKQNDVKLKPVENFQYLLQVNVQDKAKIVMDQNYKQKRLTFQEKASVASVSLLDPQSDEIIIDLCAAPGIKTSLLSQISKGRNKIIAGDFHAQRVNDMHNYLSSLGIHQVHEIQWDGIKPPLKNESVDKILLDAPCTGSGTFTSNPQLKWRQSDKFLKRNVELQQKLLEASLKLLKSNGTLVYSTCSLYPEEGEYQVQELLGDLVKPVSLPSWLPPSYKINGSYVEGSGRYLPADHNTIGFFVAKLSKK